MYKVTVLKIGLHVLAGTWIAVVDSNEIEYCRIMVNQRCNLERALIKGTTIADSLNEILDETA